MFLSETIKAAIWQLHFTNIQYWSVLYRNNSMAKKLQASGQIQFRHAPNCVWVTGV
jgi:hypothetical protein